MTTGAVLFHQGRARRLGCCSAKSTPARCMRASIAPTQAQWAAPGASALDPETTQEILALIRDLRERLSKLLDVDHALDLLTEEIQPYEPRLLGFRNYEAAFTADDEVLATHFASGAAVAIHRARITRTMILRMIRPKGQMAADSEPPVQVPVQAQEPVPQAN